MTGNNHPEPQPLSKNSDDQSTVAAPDDSSLTGAEPDEVIGNLDAGSTGSVEGGGCTTCLNRPARVGKLGKLETSRSRWMMIPDNRPGNRDARPQKAEERWTAASVGPPAARTGLECCHMITATEPPSPHPVCRSDSNLDWNLWRTLLMTGSTGTPSNGHQAHRCCGPIRHVTAGHGRSLDRRRRTRPSAEKILETGPEEVGAPTPAANSPVKPRDGHGRSRRLDRHQDMEADGYGLERSPTRTVLRTSVAGSAITAGAVIRRMNSRNVSGRMPCGPAIWHGTRGCAASERRSRSCGRTLPQVSLPLSPPASSWAPCWAEAGGDRGHRRRMPDYDYDDERRIPARLLLRLG